MSSITFLEPISTIFERNLSIRTVYGEPVRQGETTIIPIAKIAFGFGAGGGGDSARGQLATQSGSETEPASDAQGSGGGGGARLSPIGALEIGPRGTRFIRYSQFPRLAGTFAVGLGVGLLLARRAQ